MEPNKILQSDLLDILFEDRNQAYGAYELRRKYNTRISKAMGFTAALIIIAVGSSFVAKKMNTANPVKDVREVKLADVAPPPVAPPPPPPPAVKPPAAPDVQLKKFTDMVIKKDIEVNKQEVPPNNDLNDVHIGEINHDADPNLNVIVPPVVAASDGVVQAPKPDPNAIFYGVEVEASVDKKQWNRYLQSKLQRYIEDAASDGMAAGKVVVQVRFLVEKDGSISDVQALNDPGFGLGKAAIEVIKKGPQWAPGEQNGYKVRSYHTQPIVFEIAAE